MTSKGKWIPGSLTSKPEQGYNFYCEDCQRGFSAKIGYDKHLVTELHFKRAVKKTSDKLLGKNNNKSDDNLIDSERFLPSRRSDRLNFVETKNHEKKKANATEESDNIIRCPTCFANVKSSMLGKHLLSHFHCQKIESSDRRIDPEKSLILDNIHQIISQSPYQCKPCKYYFSRPAQLLQHFQDHHVIKLVKYNNNIHNLAEGENVVSRWNCSACKIRNLTPASMLDHLSNSSEHNEMEAMIQKSIPIIIKEVNMPTCRFCHKKFLLRRALESHKKGCIKNNTDTSLNSVQAKPESFGGILEYKCSTCLTSCQSLAHLRRHAMCHDENRIKSFVCDTCDAAFYEKFQLTFHKKIHTGKSVRCTFPGCTYVGRCNSEIKSHAVCHNMTSDLNCEHCDYTTSSKPHLKRHVKLVHEIGVKKFKCDLCSFDTNLMSSLKRHELTHTGEKPFKCPYHCGYSARNIENLRVHVLKRKVHPGAEMYTCNCCIREGSAVFKTSKFAEFKLHVTKEHSTDPNSKTDTGIFVIAGIRQQNASQMYDTSQELETVEVNPGVVTREDDGTI